MVDVGQKPSTRRQARARAFVRLSPATLEMIVQDEAPKGDVFAVSRLAGIMAAKKTPELIPLCHPLPLNSVKVDLSLCPEGVEIWAEASTNASTGVEMEAMVAAAAAALALYDMIKGVEKGALIEEVCLMEKSGGKSGTYRR